MNIEGDVHGAVLGFAPHGCMPVCMTFATGRATSNAPSVDVSPLPTLCALPSQTHHNKRAPAPTFVGKGGDGLHRIRAQDGGAQARLLALGIQGAVGARGRSYGRSGRSPV